MDGEERVVCASLSTKLQGHGSRLMPDRLKAGCVAGWPSPARASRPPAPRRTVGRRAGADAQKLAAEGTVGAWTSSESNPVGGFYGLKKGKRGRLANYVPPVLETLGRPEVEHNPRNNRMRALGGTPA
jgi:Family of unknown function (DUF6855)